jgi:MoaD family protein
MRIHLKLFATYREIVGRRDLTVEVKDGSTIGDVVGDLLSEYPKLEKHKEAMIYSVNKEYASLDTELNNDDEVGVLPPISGG